MEKTLIHLSFLTSLFIIWIGLSRILGARDRWEMLVQGGCALGEKEVIREYLSKQDSVLEDADNNFRILNGLCWKDIKDHPIPTPLLWAGPSHSMLGCLGPLTS